MTVHERPFGRCLEDFVVGDVYRHWPGKTITEYDDHLFCMITMNHHPLHTNDWFAEQSVQGRNVVVGNLVYSLVLGMSVPDVSGAAIANLEVETLQHKFPTFHGDTIHAETRVLEVKESSSKPDRGIVTVESKGFNQDGKEVCYFRRRVMVWKRDVRPPAGPAPTTNRPPGPDAGPCPEPPTPRPPRPPHRSAADVGFANSCTRTTERVVLVQELADLTGRADCRRWPDRDRAPSGGVRGDTPRVRSADEHDR